MPERYFEKFPQIVYSGNNSVDITRRVTLLDKVSTNPYVFYSYDLDTFERADQLSNRYYKDTYQSWLIYLTNKITDPYYEWYLQNDEFTNYIIKKYGSVRDAIRRIKYYRNDWIDKEAIDPETYEAYPQNIKNYWEPVYGVGNKVVAYKRKQEDWIVNTNKILKYRVNSCGNFTTDEVVKVYFDDYNIGKGQVITCSNNVLYIQHVSGVVSLESIYDKTIKKSISEAFIGDGVTISYTLANSLSNQNNCLVTVDGLVQIPGIHFTISGTALVFTTAPLNNTNIEVRNMEVNGEIYESYVFTGNGFTVNYATVIPFTDAKDVIVTLDGLVQIPNIDYFVSGSSVTFNAAPVAGTRIEIRNISFDFISTTSDYIISDGIQTGYSTTDIILDQDDLLVTVDGLVQIPGIHYTATGYAMNFLSTPIAGSKIELRNIIKKSQVRGYIYGENSEANVLFYSANYVANNIFEDEEVYYTGVSYFDYEYEKNEFNKNIRLLDNRLNRLAVRNLRDLLLEE